MDLRERINEVAGTVYAFAKANDISPARVYYWCNTDWDKLTWTTRQKIEGYFETYERTLQEG